MKKRHVIAGAVMGVVLAASLNLGSALAAQWVCPNGDELCPGQEYCVEHQQCVTDGYCTHSDCRLGSYGGHCGSSGRNSQNRGSHHGRCGGSRYNGC